MTENMKFFLWVAKCISNCKWKIDIVVYPLNMEKIKYVTWSWQANLRDIGLWKISYFHHLLWETKHNPIVVGSKPRQAWLFIRCLWVWVSFGSGGLKNTKNTQRMQRFILVWAIGALCLVVDDPCIQENPKSRDNNKVWEIWKRIAQC